MTALGLVIILYYRKIRSIVIVFAFESGTIWRRRRAQAWSPTSEPSRAGIGPLGWPRELTLRNSCYAMRAHAWSSENCGAGLFLCGHGGHVVVWARQQGYVEQAIPAQTAYEMKTPPCDVVRMHLKEKVYTYFQACLTIDWSFGVDK